MPVSSDLLTHVNYELFGVSIITLRLIILQHLWLRDLEYIFDDDYR